ncbi:MAG: ATP-dependent Clp protease ATP-binding subunit ClpC, partial [Atribacterota bacterium]
LMISRLRKQLQKQGMDIVLDSSVREYLAHEGYDPDYGARPLRRLIQRKIESPLAGELIRCSYKNGDRIEAYREGNEIHFRCPSAAQE